MPLRQQLGLFFYHRRPKGTWHRARNEQTVPTPAAEAAVRDYLRALHDPDSLRDDKRVKQLTKQLTSSTDGVKRLRLRQDLLNAESPSIQRYEDGFVTHARAWAQEGGISPKAFSDEGVSLEVLRRAGFNVGRGRRQSARSRHTRVTADDIRTAIPAGSFTIKQLQDAIGASPAVVRKVVAEEVQTGRLRNEGTDPDHRGPGRAPLLYRRT
jgi:hypothetical protein